MERVKDKPLRSCKPGLLVTYHTDKTSSGVKFVLKSVHLL